MKDESGAKKMRAIAEEAFSIVKEYKGSHSGEHGDGISRSEFHEMMFGERVVRAFAAVKDAFDPGGLLNPGKIVRAPKMDDRSAVPLQARIRVASGPDFARLVRRGRFPGRHGDVQQQRELPQVRRGDVPELPGDRRREGRHPGPRQQACGSPSADSSERTPWSPTR